MGDFKIIFVDQEVNSSRLSDGEIRDFLDSVNIDSDYSDYVNKLIEDLYKPKYELYAEVA